jgi:hypothetical protein
MGHESKPGAPWKDTLLFKEQCLSQTAVVNLKGCIVTSHKLLATSQLGPQDGLSSSKIDQPVDRARRVMGHFFIIIMKNDGLLLLSITESVDFDVFLKL